MFTEDVLARFWAKVKVTDTCWLWQARINDNGYGCFRLRNPRREERTHRVSWMIHHGPIPEEMCVCHRCDTPACVNPNHLFLGDHDRNMRDMSAKGRTSTTKLTEEQVNLIRKEIKGHQSYGFTKRLAEQFGVHRSTIRRAAKAISFQDI